MNSQDLRPHIADFLKNRGYENYSLTTYLDKIKTEVDEADSPTSIKHILATSTNEFIIVEDIFLVDSSNEIADSSYLNIAIKSEDRVEKVITLKGISALSIYPFKPIHKGQCALNITSTLSGTINIPYIIITPNYDKSGRKKDS